MEKKLAITSVMYRGISSLKRAALLFDGFCLANYNALEGREGEGIFNDQDYADFDYLKSRGFLREPAPRSPFFDAIIADECREDLNEVLSATPNSQTGDEIGSAPDGLTWDVINKLNDFASRLLVRRMSWMFDLDITPLLCASPPQPTKGETATVYRIALDCLPVPDDTCSWEEILDFKEENGQKEWALRRFLRSLTTKAVSEAEVRDDIEWSINEYRQAMALHKMKQNLSRLESYVVLPVEIAESLVKFNWSTIAKGLLSVKKRKIEAIEDDQNSPGKECAYVFHAQERFDRS